MKHLIIYCHPNPKSFNHAVLEAYKGLLEGKGGEVRVRDLYGAGFDPVLKAEDFTAFSRGNVPEDIKAEQEEILWADVVTFIYPVWWFQMPAMLKGYLDRVFSRGFAYDVGEGGLVGLLKGKKVVILNTTGGSREDYENKGFKEALRMTHEIGCFGICGMEVVLHRFFYAVPFLARDERKAILEDLKESELPL